MGTAGRRIIDAVALTAALTAGCSKPAEVKPSPLLGESTAEVLKSWLGKSEEEVVALKSQRIAGG